MLCHPESLYDFKVYYVFLIPLKISTNVLMDHATMAEVAQMLWMIITVAVSLDIRARTVVLVSQSAVFIVLLRRDVKITVWLHEGHHRIFTNMGSASLQLAMTYARFARDKIINRFREGASRPRSAQNENLRSHEPSHYSSVILTSDWQEERGFRFKHSTIKTL